ncbi:MAG: hypothetical protein RL885_23270 [Planctomycetota bacterium]
MHRALMASLTALLISIAACQATEPPADESAGSTAEAPAPQGFVDTIEGLTAADLELEWVVPHRDGDSSFVIGGRNETVTIRSLESINGISIAEIETRMRPGAEGEAGSTAGFLGPDESLLEVMATDNETVVETWGLTHQDLARSLKLLGTYGMRPRGEIRYRGMRFTVEAAMFRGFQLSPFRDGTKTNLDVKIDNLDNGKSLELSMLVPEMIERYGFYEGHGTPYRVDPKDIVELLGLAP